MKIFALCFPESISVVFATDLMGQLFTISGAAKNGKSCIPVWLRQGSCVLLPMLHVVALFKKDICIPGSHKSKFIQITGICCSWYLIYLHTICFEIRRHISDWTLTDNLTYMAIICFEIRSTNGSEHSRNV